MRNELSRIGQPPDHRAKITGSLSFLDLHIPLGREGQINDRVTADGDYLTSDRSLRVDPIPRTLRCPAVGGILRGLLSGGMDGLINSFGG